MNMDQIARVCHEVNRAYCESLGDFSQPAWEDAPEWQRASARMGVDLHTMGDFGPEASHISWMKEKLEQGWKWGPVKDPEKKEHHCMVPFSQLPREQQSKDFIFRAVVHALRPNAQESVPGMLHIDDLDTFVRILTAWHQDKVAMLKHLQDIPEGTAFQVGDGEEAKDLVLTPEMLEGFQFGIEMALMQVGELPFVAETEDTPPQPADAAAG